MHRRLVFESVLPVTPQELWEFHSSVEALKILTPPDAQVQVIGDGLAVRDGAVHILKVKKFGLPIVWKALISDVVPGRQFRDTALKSPFPSWSHLHEFLPHSDGALLRDTVDYVPPMGPFGFIVDALFVKKDLEKMFAYRHEATSEALKRQISSEN